MVRRQARCSMVRPGGLALMRLQRVSDSTSSDPVGRFVMSLLADLVEEVGACIGGG